MSNLWSFVLRHKSKKDDVELGSSPGQTSTSDPRSLADLHRHLSLDPTRREIRLLDLKASSERDAPLQGDLRVVALADSPHFTALSYVWGDPPVGDYSIRINDASAHLTYNCFQALSQIRKNYGAVTIWVDSICINQGDDVEKNSQIPLMGEIYSWAKKVYIWLGDADEASDMVMNRIWWLSQMQQCSEFLPLISDTSTTRDKLLAIKDFTANIGLRALLAMASVNLPMWILRYFTRMSYADVFLPDKFGRAVLGLLSRPWFQRAWTFQELILSWDPIILCGEQQVGWNDFALGADVLLRSLAGAVIVSETHKDLLLDVNLGLEGVVSLLLIWVRLPRPTKWNGLQQRQIAGQGDFSSISDYQQLLRGKDQAGRRWRVLYSLVVRFFQTCLFVSDVSIAWVLPAAWLAVIYSRLSGDLLDADQFKVVSVLICWAGAGFLYFMFCWMANGVSLLKGEVKILPQWFPQSVSDFRHSLDLVSRALERTPARGATATETTKTIQREIAKLREEDPSVHGGNFSTTTDGIVLAIRERVSTEPADRLKALLGILTQLGAVERVLDPGASTHLVYTETLGQILNWQPLTILLIMDVDGPPPQGSRRPSWVPAWDEIPLRPGYRGRCFSGMSGALTTAARLR